MIKILFLAFIFCTTSTYAITPKSELLLKKSKLQIPDKFRQFFTGNEEIFLPLGFTMSVFAAGIDNPRFFAWRQDGMLFCGSGWPGTVYSFPDINKDGSADTVIRAATGLNIPHSLAFYRGELYIAETDSINVYTDEENDGSYSFKRNFIARLPTDKFSNDQPAHVTRTILFDTLNNYFYVSIGSSCDACREKDSTRASILRFNIDGTGKKIFASGLRNAVGLDIDPATGKLWATVAERNGIPEYPDEMVTEIKEGGFYGWPLAYGKNIWMDFDNLPLYKAMLPLSTDDSAKVASMQHAGVYLTPHTTPLGIHFYTKEKFPAEYRNKPFIAVHGSGKDQLAKYEGYNVILLQKDAQNSWTYADFINGFLTSDTSYWGRPAGITSDAEGNLYISSDFGIPAIYKISFDASLDVKNSLEENFSSEFYPNPLQKEQPSSIKFSLPNSGEIKISFFDAQGNFVEEIFSGESDAGEFLLPIDLQKFSSGLYFYRVEFFSGAKYCTSSGKIIVE